MQTKSLNKFKLLFVLTSILQIGCNHHEKNIKLMIKCGFNPTSVVDVGANVGEWSQSALKLLPKSQFFMIEGNSNHQNVLKASNIPFTIALVSSEISNVTFHVGQGAGTGSSIFPENTIHNFIPKIVTAYPLDDILIKNNISPPQLLKVDVQGAELKILKGAKNTLQSLEVIFLECPVHNYNQGAPSFLRLHTFLAHAGFELYDMVNFAYANTNYMVQFDAIFVKRASKLWSKECTGFPTPAYFNSGSGGSSSNNQDHS